MKKSEIKIGEEYAVSFSPNFIDPPCASWFVVKSLERADRGSNWLVKGTIHEDGFFPRPSTQPTRNIRMPWTEYQRLVEERRRRLAEESQRRAVKRQRFADVVAALGDVGVQAEARMNGVWLSLEAVEVLAERLLEARDDSTAHDMPREGWTMPQAPGPGCAPFACLDSTGSIWDLYWLDHSGERVGEIAWPFGDNAQVEASDMAAAGFRTVVV